MVSRDLVQIFEYIIYLQYNPFMLEQLEIYRRQIETNPEFLPQIIQELAAAKGMFDEVIDKLIGIPTFILGIEPRGEGNIVKSDRSHFHLTIWPVWLSIAGNFGGTTFP